MLELRRRFPGIAENATVRRCVQIIAGSRAEEQALSDRRRARRPTRVDIAWQIMFRCGFPLARLWWRLRRQRHEGALVAIHVG